MTRFRYLLFREPHITNSNWLTSQEAKFLGLILCLIIPFSVFRFVFPLAIQSSTSSSDRRDSAGTSKVYRPFSFSGIH